MKKFTKSILAGLCAVVGLTVGAAVCTLPKQVDVQTAYAETTYTTVDNAFMAYLDDCYAPGGNFYLNVTMSQLDTTTANEGVAYDTSVDDMPTMFNRFDLFNKIKVNGYTLAELGCTSVWENAFDVNAGGGAPSYKLRFHMHADPTIWQEAISAGKVVFGPNSNVTVSEGTLIPGYEYMTGNHSATVYRAGCDFVSSGYDVAYGIMTVGKTEVVALDYVTGWDATYSNAYLGVSLKGDDFLGDGSVVERHPDYYSSVYTTNQFPNKITVDGEAGKTESYGLFNHGSNAQGYYSFVIRAAEDDSETITIPAGTMFPSRAMRTLLEKNGNPVYIMYETQTDVTFYKQADGTWKRPYVDKETDVTSVKVAGDAGDNFTVISLANHDYLETLDNYGGTVVTTKDMIANGNFYTHVLIDGVALGTTNEAYVNVWGNKGAFAFRTNNGLLTSEITILAGCQFPSYAELSTGERIRFVTTKDVTFVKNAEGVFVEKSQNIGNLIEEAKAELDAYKAGLFREAEEGQRLQIVETAKAQLSDTMTEEDISGVVRNAKIEIDALKTAEQYEAEEKEALLAAAREAAFAEINAYKADEVYFEEQGEERQQAIVISQSQLAADTNEDEIAATVAWAKECIDKVLTKAQVIENAKAELDAYKATEGYFLEEEAAQRAEIVANAKTEIDNAATQTAVNSAIINAKAAIDELTPAVEVYTTQDAAMMGRVAGWYGNGNFTLAITLGSGDWTNDNAGVKEYNGDLAKLLNKLDLFNHIKLGEKTLAQWGCVACYDNSYELNTGEPDYILLLHLAMGAENMAAATAAGIGVNCMATILEGALVPSYGYLSQTGNVVYRAGCDYVTISSGKPYGMEATAKTTVESVKYVQGHDGTCGYFGISFVGDDYLGDGTILEINQDYYYDRKFVDQVLVNGEAGKVAYYGLFNLGEKGAGYYAFQIFVPEEELVSITIPAGAAFPTRAMTTLCTVNGNPVYMMYEVAETITLYKTEDGYVSYANLAIKDVENYKVGLFREAEEAQRAEIAAQAVATIRAAADNAAIDEAVAQAKAAIDALKTAGQYADEENAALAAAKEKAIAEIEGYKADQAYFEEQVAQRAEIINAAKEALSGISAESDITAIVDEAKAAIDALIVKTTVVEAAKAELDGYKAEDGYFKEEEAAQRAEIVANAKAAIDNATTQAAVNEAVVSAKAAIDALFAANEYFTTQDVAMLARLGGWYGNGNFTLKITLGSADWNNDIAGEKAYAGDLAILLNKLGFFDHVKVGGKTLAEWGCTACYDNNYELNTGEPDYIFLFHLAMGEENMKIATEAGVKADMAVTILEGALIPSYGYLTGESDVVYRAGCDYESTLSNKPYGIESAAKAEIESVKYVQGHDGTCGYLGISFVGDDYLGNGTMLEINQDYYYDRKFADLVLVNGEAGKVGYYGLFNLGENGVGYYAFQILVPEEDVVSITIPAGTRFPTRAMTDLFVVNSNPVYIMYEVADEITLYKTADGYVSDVESVIDELENYKAGLFREAEETQRVEIIENAVATIRTASDNATINATVAQAKAAIDALKTAGQYADEENAALADAKVKALAEIETYKANEAYFEAEQMQRAEIINAAQEAMSGIENEADVAKAVANAKAAIDGLVTKTEIVEAAIAEVEAHKADFAYSEEQAAQRATIIENAKSSIEKATTQEAVEEAATYAKAAIDVLTMVIGEYVTQDVAMIARLGGWYGNGNFILKITLGEADWNNDLAGEKTFAGDLAGLLNTLGFFDHVKVGDKTLAEWGCTACYDNNYELNTGEPDYMFVFHLTMSQENMDAATAAGIKADMPVTILEGALVPSYGYLTQTSDVVYRAGCDYVTIESTKAYGMEAAAKVEIEDVKYVQGHDGTCGYLGISFVGDDYLGDGTQLEINQNYYFDGKFADLVLVNGEAGKVGYYGLFNLGENGAGYYAFQIFATEEEVETITIPAGTRFPTRAMTDLFVVNGNPVYIMYEVESEIVLYKSANGFVSGAEAAAADVESYKAGLFREAEEAQRVEIVAQAIEAIYAAADDEAVKTAVAEAKAAIDALKTAAQYADEELAGDKQAAISAMEEYKADVAYLEEQAQARANVILAGKEKVAAAVTLEELAAIVDEAKAEIDKIETKEVIVSAALAEVEGYKADEAYLDEQAAEKAAVIEGAKAAIESATTQTAIVEAVAKAKVDVDAIMTKAEIEAAALKAKQDEANAEVDALKKAIDFDIYEEDAITTINGLYATVKAAIENAATQEEIDAAVAAFKAALEDVPQKDIEDTSSDNESVPSDTSSKEEKPKKKGCSSAVSGLVYGMVALGLAAVLFKRKED